MRLEETFGSQRVGLMCGGLSIETYDRLVRILKPVASMAVPRTLRKADPNQFRAWTQSSLSAERNTKRLLPPCKPALNELCPSLVKICEELHQESACDVWARSAVGTSRFRRWGTLVAASFGLFCKGLSRTHTQQDTVSELLPDDMTRHVMLPC